MKRLFLATIALIFACVGHAHAASTVTAYADPAIAQRIGYQCGKLTSCNVTLPGIPATGDAVLCHIADTAGSAFSLTAQPWGFLGVGSSTSAQFASQIGIASFVHTVATSDYAALTTPGAPTLSTASGGSLTAATYYYKVSAQTGNGETTVAGAEASIATSASGQNTISWTAVPNAASYTVLRSTSTGTEIPLAVGITSTSFIDSGVWTPAGTAPTANTTGVASLPFAVATGPTWDVTCEDWQGVSTSAPVQPTIAGAGGNASSLTLAALTPNAPGTLAVEIDAQASGNSTISDPAFTKANWLLTQTGLTVGELQQATPWHSFTLPITAAPSFSVSAPSAAEVIVLQPLVTTFTITQTAVALNTGGTPTPAPTATPIVSTPTPAPTPTPTPAPGQPNGHVLTQVMYGSYYGVGNTLTSTMVHNLISYCFGPSDNALANGCDDNPSHPLIYYTATIAQNTSYGRVTSAPFNGAYNSNGSNARVGPCPDAGVSYMFADYAKGVAFPTSYAPDETWFMHATGTSAAPQNRITAFYHQYTGSEDATMMTGMNIGSTSLQNYIKQYIATCFQKNTVTNAYYAIDSMYGIFEDNAGVDMFDDMWAMGDVSGYTVQKNAGTATQIPTPALYASYNCGANEFLGKNTTTGAYQYCTATSQISTTKNTTTLEYGSQSAYEAAWASFEANAFVHANGSKIPTEYNEGLATTDLIQLANNPNAIGMMMEKQVLDAGSFAYNYYVTNVIDVCATINNDYPNSGCILEDTDPATQTKDGVADPIGSNTHQLHLRQHFGVFWLIYSPHTVDNPYLESSYSTNANCGAGGTSKCNTVQVWPMDFLVPANPVQTATDATGLSAGAPCSYWISTNQCAFGGYRDYVVSGSGLNVVVRREFNDTYWQPNYNNSHVGQVDYGKSAVIVNLGSTAVTFNSGWLTNWPSYAHMVSQCAVGAGGSYTSPGCSPTTSGGDVLSAAQDTGSGPGLLDFTQPASWAIGRTLPAHDAWFFIQKP